MSTGSYAAYEAATDNNRRRRIGRRGARRDSEALTEAMIAPLLRRSGKADEPLVHRAEGDPVETPCEIPESSGEHGLGPIAGQPVVESRTACDS